MNTFGFLDFDANFSSPHVMTAYDERPLWSALFGLLLLEEIPLTGVRTALDVGCGTGVPLIELAERLGPGAHVHGIDPWSLALTRAADKASCRHTQNITLHESTASAMPFADATFDLIVSNLGVNNFDDPAACIRECRRVAKPSSVIALSVAPHCSITTSSSVRSWMPGKPSSSMIGKPSSPHWLTGWMRSRLGKASSG
jgi:arsenite methyltransferase